MGEILQYRTFSRSFKILAAKQDNKAYLLLVFWRRLKEILGFQNNNLMEDYEVTDVIADITEKSKSTVGVLREETELNTKNTHQSKSTVLENSKKHRVCNHIF